MDLSAGVDVEMSPKDSRAHKTVIDGLRPIPTTDS
jgi:hypothetical protein